MLEKSHRNFAPLSAIFTNHYVPTCLKEKKARETAFYSGPELFKLLNLLVCVGKLEKQN